jgi:hypothetical protein
MPDQLTKFASSSNGDCWLLGRDPQSGFGYVLHEANRASGGARTRIEVGEFLAHRSLAPEHCALLSMIGGLASQQAPEETGTLDGQSPARPHSMTIAGDSASDAGGL